MWFDHQKFFSVYQAALGKHLSASQLSGLDRLLGFVQIDSDINDVRWVAYMLATVKHECADTWQPIVEFGKPSYFKKYDPVSKTADRLGNTEVGEGEKFKGRGYVQITGKRNYTLMSEELHLGTQLVTDPDQALEPVTAYRIMSLGMRKGLFTRKNLSMYINGDTVDYISARRIINALDQAEKIAGYAEVLEKCLEAATINTASPVTEHV